MLKMSCMVRNPACGVSDHLQLRLGSTATENGLPLNLQIYEEGVLLTICIKKSKPLISCTVTTQLNCAFVFEYAKRLFSDGVADKMNTIAAVLWFLKL